MSIYDHKNDKRKNKINDVQGFEIKHQGPRTRTIYVYWYKLKDNPDLLTFLILSDWFFVSPIQLGKEIYPNDNIRVYGLIKNIFYYENKKDHKNKPKNLKKLMEDDSSSKRLINKILDVIDKDKSNLYLYSIVSHFEKILNSDRCELKNDVYGRFVERFVLYAKNRIYKSDQLKIKRLNIITLVISILSIVFSSTIGIWEIIKK